MTVMRGRVRRLSCMLLALFAAAVFARASALTVSVSYPASGEELQNPYIGNAVWAMDEDDHAQPFTLVYANLRWADFEPEQGVYDFASFEAENQFGLWRAQGKHLILRFVMDLPSGKRHRDIPDWLYEATGKDGTVYNVDYGRGYSPDYTNETLIVAHARAVAALGERYGSDPFVAYIELGSLGHWGEWHVDRKIGSMPDAAVRDQYVLPYLSAFPDALILMRRPFAIAAEYGLGLYNDTAGEPKSTETWLGWIQNGGDYGESNDGAGALAPMPDAWRTAPVGGELSTGIKREKLLGELFEQTLSLFKRSHASWIGPGSFADVARGGAYQDALDALNRTVGYRLRIARCDVREDGDMALVTLYWTNDGIAPFYFPWQPTLAVTGADGSETRLPLELRLIDILPGQTVLTETALPLPDAGGAYALWAGIVDPSTNEPGVALAMHAEQDGLWYALLRVDAP